ncbi:hypothetical protein EXIGLDRAFT_834682 [Exidia glandulosa HHB12029]|uniref:GPR1/FUN34/YaaH-class plasma membrane protein n=1 Tax=Exidia glandulosa HHB12029 TaxID=1314781 RepID=A0A165JHC2_EXIGL|nr:hypothetical protein EXIGLDRAFT_834682 [Exidia glandulosa HHB12029]
MSEVKVHDTVHEEFSSAANTNDPEIGLHRQMTTVTLSPEQFEALYLQPKGSRQGLIGGFANPTALGVSSFLLAQTPLAMDLMGFRGATSASAVAQLGSYYACAGIGLYIAALLEWVAGNTFPMVVFGSFGGFWLSYAITISPSMAIAASFAPGGMSDVVAANAAGQASSAYNSGLGLYFLTWGILCALYTVVALRTNVPFVIVFLSLTISFPLVAAGYFQTGMGNTDAASRLFVAGGVFAFVVSVAGFYIDVHLLLAAVDFPFNIPIFDLSAVVRGRTSRKEVRKRD